MGRRPARFLTSPHLSGGFNACNAWSEHRLTDRGGAARALLGGAWRRDGRPAAADIQALGLTKIVAGLGADNHQELSSTWPRCGAGVRATESPDAECPFDGGGRGGGRVAHLQRLPPAVAEEASAVVRSAATGGALPGELRPDIGRPSRKESLGWGLGSRRAAGPRPNKAPELARLAEEARSTARRARGRVSGPIDRPGGHASDRRSGGAAPGVGRTWAENSSSIRKGRSCRTS